MTDSACCAASRDPSPSVATAEPVIIPGGAATASGDMVLLPGGQFLMGTDDREGYPADGEGPVRKIRLSPFWIDRAAVSNHQFADFVQATGYRTEAERF